MTSQLRPGNFGEPALQVAGLKIWVHGRQFPESEDFYDGNWLRITAHCSASGASVWVQGSVLMVADIERFGEQCAKLLCGETEAAALDPFEPELHVSVKAVDTLGHLCVEIRITPDNLLQAHRFEFEIDQSHLPEIIRKCSEIVREYPVRGRNDL